MNDINDAYSFLALYIVCHYCVPDIQKAMTDDEWLKSELQRECVHMDIGGPFVDAVMQDIADHEKLWLRGVMKELGAALFTKLDIERLRDNISRIMVMP